MSNQPMNLRRSVQFLRRQKTLVGAVGGLGLIAGAAFGSINPPPLTSQALVVLPSSGPAIATQLVIASSDPVLAGALPDIHPAPADITALRHELTVSNASPNIVTISGQGASAAGAESVANAVAGSYVGYLASSQSPVGKVNARLLQPATSASGPDPLTHRLVYALIGALAGLLAGIIAGLARGRGDRRLRARDDIANSIGAPVLASVPVGRPASAQDWGRLFECYQPSVVHAWRLRKTLQHLNVTGLDIIGTRQPAGSSVAVISLASDYRALALGPQLAAFAASLGIPTALVIDPAGHPEITAGLSAACAAWHGTTSRPNLRAAVLEEGDELPRDVLLSVVVKVVDAKKPVTTGVRTTTALLGVSSGAVTAEQMARIAISADIDGCEIAGFLVANPDPADHTTGRIPQMPRPAARMPKRLTGMTTEVTR
jgi:hypothetical protein